MRLLNVLFSAATTYAIFLLGRGLFGEASGIVAGWIWAFFWYAIFFPATWLWDTSLSALMLCLAVWATYAVEKRRDWKSWSGFGFLWGLAALVNPAILSVLPGCFGFAVYRSRQRSRAWWKSAGASALTLALTVAPWIIRNQITFHGQVFFRSNFGLELWLGNNPQVPDSWTWWLHPSDDKTEHDKFLRMGEVPYMQEKQREAWLFIKTHPSDFCRFVFHRFMETWTDSDSFADLWNSGFLSVRVGLILKYALPLLTFSGLLLARRNSPLLALPLVNVVAMFPLVYYLCHTTARYRHPMDPVLCVLSGLTLVSVARAVSEKFFHPAQAVQKPPVMSFEQ